MHCIRIARDQKKIINTSKCQRAMHRALISCRAVKNFCQFDRHNINYATDYINREYVVKFENGIA